MNELTAKAVAQVPVWTGKLRKDLMDGNVVSKLQEVNASNKHQCSGKEYLTTLKHYDAFAVDQL